LGAFGFLMALFAAVLKRTHTQAFPECKTPAACQPVPAPPPSEGPSGSSAVLPRPRPRPSVVRGSRPGLSAKWRRIQVMLSKGAWMVLVAWLASAALLDVVPWATLAALTTTGPVFLVLGMMLQEQVCLVGAGLNIKQNRVKTKGSQFSFATLLKWLMQSPPASYVPMTVEVADDVLDALADEEDKTTVTSEEESDRVGSAADWQCLADATESCGIDLGLRDYSALQEDLGSPTDRTELLTSRSDPVGAVSTRKVRGRGSGSKNPHARSPPSRFVEHCENDGV